MRFGKSVLTTWLLVVPPVGSFLHPNNRAAFRTELRAEDKYADVLSAYQKKASVVAAEVAETATVTTPDIPSIPDPVVVVEAVKTSAVPVVTKVEPMVSSYSAATATTTTKATTVVGEKAPTLFEFARSGVKNVDAAQGFDRVANAKEKLAILKSNIVSGAGVPKNADISIPNIPDLKAKIAATATATPSNTEAMNAASIKFYAAYSALVEAILNFDIQGAVDAVDFKSNGPWYLLGATLFWGISQRRVGREEAQRDFQKELEKAKARADEATEAAEVAAEGVAMVMKMKGTGSGGPDANQALLESTKVKVIELEKVRLYEIRICVNWTLC